MLSNQNITRLWVSVLIVSAPLLSIKIWNDFWVNPPPHQTIADRLLLPMGISFYTLQVVGYLIDVKNRKIDVIGSWLPRILFIFYFPKIIAGPIERAQNFIGQMKFKKLKVEELHSSLALVALGLFKKLALGNALYPLVFSVLANPDSYAGWVLAITLIYARYQIYYDFSGYTDVARGCSRLIGIELSKNFEYPFFSVSIAKFWQRWHISLSNWIRDYIFYSLTLTLKSNFGIYVSIFACFILLGLWHGISINFFIFGMLQGFFLTVYALFNKRLKANPLSNTISWLINFIVCISFPMVFFWVQSFDDSVHILQKILFVHDGGKPTLMSYQIHLLIFTPLFDFFMWQASRKNLYGKLRKQPFFIRWPIYWLGIIAFIYFTADSQSLPFSYSKF